jgi:hypothetical protein
MYGIVERQLHVFVTSALYGVDWSASRRGRLTGGSQRGRNVFASAGKQFFAMFLEVFVYLHTSCVLYSGFLLSGLLVVHNSFFLSFVNQIRNLLCTSQYVFYSVAMFYAVLL